MKIVDFYCSITALNASSSLDALVFDLFDDDGIWQHNRAGHGCYRDVTRTITRFTPCWICICIWFWRIWAAGEFTFSKKRGMDSILTRVSDSHPWLMLPMQLFVPWLTFVFFVHWFVSRSILVFLYVSCFLHNVVSCILSILFFSFFCL